ALHRLADHGDEVLALLAPVAGEVGLVTTKDINFFGHLDSLLLCWWSDAQPATKNLPTLMVGWLKKRVPGAALARMLGTGTPDFSIMAMVSGRPMVSTSTLGGA